MTKTFARNGIINENFTEVPNLVTYFSYSTDMSRTYQVNRLGQINGGFAHSTATIDTTANNEQANSSVNLYEEEEVSLFTAFQLILSSKLSLHFVFAFNVIKYFERILSIRF